MVDRIRLSKELGEFILQGKKKCPWSSEKGKGFPFRCLKDMCMVWPLPDPEKFEGTGIYIPEQTQENYRKSFGVLCSVGPGYHRESGEFIPTKLKPYSVVMYDISTLWWIEAPDHNGKEYFIQICGEQDVKGIAVDEEVMK